MKAGGLGKQRLARHLSEAQRGELVRVMLVRCSRRCATAAIRKVLVLSGARGQVPAAIEVLGDPGTGLMRRSHLRLLPELQEARRPAADDALFADLPLVRAADVAALMAAAGDAAVAVAPDHAGPAHQCADAAAADTLRA